MEGYSEKQELFFYSFFLFLDGFKHLLFVMVTHNYFFLFQKMLDGPNLIYLGAFSVSKFMFCLYYLNFK